MNPAQRVLFIAQSRIRQGWTQNTSARDVDGNPCMSQSSKAVCWCTLGALSAAKVRDLPEDVRTIVYRSLEVAVKAFGGPSDTARWNDEPHRTKEDVIEVFDEAIRIAETLE